MSYYENLQAICKSKGTTLTTVLKKSNLSPSYVTHWNPNKERFTKPTFEQIVSVAKCLETSLDVIAGIEQTSFTTENQILINKFSMLTEENKSRILERIDILLESQPKRGISKYKPSYSSKIEYFPVKHSTRKVSAGAGFELPEGDEWDEIYVPDTKEAHECDFALTIKGVSMMPIYNDGDTVLVKAQERIEVGQIGIFIVDNKMSYIKKLGSDRLVSLNENSDDIPFNNGVSFRCVGLVIAKV